jgi:hypothetical protein
VQKGNRLVKPKGNGRMAYASRGICGGARHRQPIVTHKLRNDISVLEGSGGILTGPDGKVLIDAGIGVSRPQITRALAGLGADPITRLINTHWHFDHADGNAWLNSVGAKIMLMKTRSSTFPRCNASRTGTIIFFRCKQAGFQRSFFKRAKAKAKRLVATIASYLDRARRRADSGRVGVVTLTSFTCQESQCAAEAGNQRLMPVPTEPKRLSAMLDKC